MSEDKTQNLERSNTQSVLSTRGDGRRWRSAHGAAWSPQKHYNRRRYWRNLRI